MYGWRPPGGDDSEYLRRAAISSYRVQQARDSHELWQRIVEEVSWWLEPTAVRAVRFDERRQPVVVVEAGERRLPVTALQMEAGLLVRSLEAGRSLISNHPNLTPELVPLSRQLAETDSVVHAVLLRRFQQTHGAVVVHWIHTPRPGFERRAGFYVFAENAALAVANQEEREALRRAAYFDTKTGLPNQAALERELKEHASTGALGVLVADFDGMREANAAFDGDYARGGDVLIRAVGVALERFAGPGEFAARMNTAGDEFCLLLPGADDGETQRRAGELEAALDTLEMPASHRHVYRGASVGGAVRHAGETPGQTLGRASTAMRTRKLERAGQRGAA